MFYLNIFGAFSLKCISVRFRLVRFRSVLFAVAFSQDTFSFGVLLDYHILHVLPLESFRGKTVHNPLQVMSASSCHYQVSNFVIVVLRYCGLKCLPQK